MQQSIRPHLKYSSHWLLLVNEASNQQITRFAYHDLGKYPDISWSHRVNISSNNGLVSTTNKPVPEFIQSQTIIQSIDNHICWTFLIDVMRKTQNWLKTCAGV